MLVHGRTKLMQTCGLLEDKNSGFLGFCPARRQTGAMDTQRKQRIMREQIKDRHTSHWDLDLLSSAELEALMTGNAVTDESVTDGQTRPEKIESKG